MNQMRLSMISAALLLASGILLPITSPATDNECIACHKNPDFYAQYPKLHQYYEDWQESPHKKAGATCDDCHGGNPATSSIKKAHATVLPVNDARSALHYQNQPATCGQCHNEKRSQFVQSKHYEALSGQRAAPTCTTCHPAMNRRPDYRVMVLNACRNCHGDGNSENLPLVSDHAASVFHQLNVTRGFLGWANIYYESHDWPDDSTERMRNLEARYETVLDQVHRFDMQQTELAVIEIQAELREVFDAARLRDEQQSKEDS